jgi:hypothetical protein
MSDKKQSSVEWLFQQLWDTPKDKLEWQTILKEAIEIHKKEIIKSCGAGYVSASDGFPLQEGMNYANYYYLSRYQK